MSSTNTIKPLFSFKHKDQAGKVNSGSLELYSTPTAQGLGSLITFNYHWIPDNISLPQAASGIPSITEILIAVFTEMNNCFEPSPFYSRLCDKL